MATRRRRKAKSAKRRKQKSKPIRARKPIRRAPPRKQKSRKARPPKPTRRKTYAQLTAEVESLKKQVQDTLDRQREIKILPKSMRSLPGEDEAEPDEGIDFPDTPPRGAVDIKYDPDTGELSSFSMPPIIEDFSGDYDGIDWDDILDEYEDEYDHEEET